LLRSPSNDRAIIAELGGGHETNLADVWCLLRRQAKGEDGALQTNSVPNIFFVRDSAGELGVVDSVWGGAGWEIGASPVGDKRIWSPGARVISRWSAGVSLAGPFRCGLPDKSLFERRFDPGFSPSARLSLSSPDT
jgi:hypothetical protein